MYNAYFVPTVPGDYTFHFSGSIHDKVNITVKSSPTTFDSAHDPQRRVPQQAPSNLQLAQRLNAESARLSAGVQAADSKAASASVALAVGIAGLVVGGGAVRRRRGPAPAARDPGVRRQVASTQWRGMRSLRAVLLVAVLALAGVGVLASPAYAHACWNGRIRRLARRCHVRPT